MTRALAILVVAATLTACSYRLWVRVDGDLASPHFVANAPRVMDPEICLRRMIVTTVSEPDRPLWKIEGIGACAPGGELRYGVTPPGFVETTPAQPLGVGILYDVAVHSNAAGGRIQIIFVDGRWRSVAV